MPCVFCSGSCHPVAHLHAPMSDVEAFMGGAAGRDRRRYGGRAIRFGVITAFRHEDPSSRSLLRACRALGEAAAIDPSRLSVEVSSGSDEDRRGARVLHGGTPLSSFDVLLLVRGLAPEGDGDLQLSIEGLLGEDGGLVINALEPLLLAQDKLRTSAILARAGIPTPAAAAVQAPADVSEALAFLGRAVAKPQWGSLGDGVELLPHGEAGMRRAGELLEECRSLYLQAFVDHGGRDLRAFVVGDRVEASIERTAPPGEFRTNVGRGGAPRELSLAPGLERLAVSAAQVLGLEWAGVDLVVGRDGPTVIEVNGSPGWEGVHQATGRDMGEAIALYAAQRALHSIEREARMEEGG